MVVIDRFHCSNSYLRENAVVPTLTNRYPDKTERVWGLVLEYVHKISAADSDFLRVNQSLINVLVSKKRVKYIHTQFALCGHLFCLSTGQYCTYF